MCVLSLFRLFATLWTVACQPPLSMGLSTQEYWSGLPFPSPGDLPGPETEPVSPAAPALAGRFFTTSVTWEAYRAMQGRTNLGTKLAELSGARRSPCSSWSLQGLGLASQVRGQLQGEEDPGHPLHLT